MNSKDIHLGYNIQMYNYINVDTWRAGTILGVRGPAVRTSNSRY